MSQYGYSFDNSYNPNHDNIYKLLSYYFDNPTLHKIEDKNSHSMYAVKIHSLLGTEYRYIIAITEQDYNPIGTPFPLSNLRWKALQTRTLTENYNVPTVSYNVKRKQPFNTSIELKNRTNTHTEYSSKELPITVTLLHKQNLAHEYPNKGTIVTAIETYYTVITV